jgi:hypothetical protein
MTAGPPRGFIAAMMVSLRRSVAGALALYGAQESGNMRVQACNGERDRQCTGARSLAIVGTEPREAVQTMIRMVLETRCFDGNYWADRA